MLLLLSYPSRPRLVDVLCASATTGGVFSVVLAETLCCLSRNSSVSVLHILGALQAKAASDAALSTSVASLEASIAQVQPDLLPPGDLIGMTCSNLFECRTLLGFVQIGHHRCCAALAEIAVESAGACSGNYIRVWRNGELINYNAGRGLSVYVFRGENLSFVSIQRLKPIKHTHSTACDVV
jgi:hypothetical protein